MTEVNFFDHFDLPWARNGVVDGITDSQWAAGWSFVGPIPPSVEQFNRVQQISDQKAAWLFSQFQALAEAAGFSLAAGSDDALTRGIAGVAPGRLLRTTIYTKQGNTQYISVDGAPRATQGALVFNAMESTAFVEVEVQGGGGGGGGAPAASQNTVSLSGGGGDGSYAMSRLEGALEDVAVTVGAAGAGGLPGVNPGSVGGTSSFGIFVSAPGGVGGRSVDPVVPPMMLRGSSVGDQPMGGNLLARAGSLGPSSYGLSLDAAISMPSPSSKFGNGGFYGHPATGPGAGGGGLALERSAPPVAAAGGSGGPGLVIVREYA